MSKRFVYFQPNKKDLKDKVNAILAISRPRPIIKVPYIMAFDTGNISDGIDFDSFEAAKGDAEDTLVEWMVNERHSWKDVFHPTEKELEAYNYMICTSSVSVMKYNPDTDEYETEWEPSYEEEAALGWQELTIEDVQKNIL